MEFLLLGPLEVRAETGPLPLGGPKQRALLALLLLNANNGVSADRIVDALWGEEPPATASASLQNHVSRLRKVLGPDRLVTRPDGYVLRVAPDELDLDRFEQLVEEARSEQASERVARLREALALWRGSALGDIGDELFARSEAMRLDELRLTALEDRIAADLELGRHAAVVPELEALAAAHPLRERLRGLLILALYRSGRQAEALEEYRTTRRMLMDELGLEPTPELRRLEQAILAHDESVRLPAESDATTPPAASAPPSSRRRIVLAAAVVVALATAGGTALIAARGSSGPAVRPNSVALLDPRSGDVIGAVPVGTLPGPVAFGEGAVWVGNIGDETLSRIDPRTREVVSTVRLGFAPGAVAAGEDAVWVADAIGGTITRIDPKTNRGDRTIYIGAGGPGAIPLATGWGSVWVGNENDLTLSRLVAPEGEVVALLRDAPGKSIAVTRTDVWMLNARGSEVWRIDPVTDAVVTRIPVGRGGWALAADARGVWVADVQDDAVWWIDPKAGVLRKSFPVGQDPRAIAVGAETVWVANSLDGSVSRLDVASGTIETVHLGDKVGGIAVGAGAVWVAVD